MIIFTIKKEIILRKIGCHPATMERLGCTGGRPGDFGLIGFLYIHLFLGFLVYIVGHVRLCVPYYFCGAHFDFLLVSFFLLYDNMYPLCPMEISHVAGQLLETPITCSIYNHRR